MAIVHSTILGFHIFMLVAYESNQNMCKGHPANVGLLFCSFF
jgi:hypothetical protein